MQIKGLALWNNLNLANKITILRIFALVPVVLLLSFPSPITCFLATLIFALACISDMLDGYIARKSQLITNLGKFLDPLADKLLIIAVCVVLVELAWIPAWVTIIITIRELAVTGLRAVAADEGIVIAADKYGKLKTIFQMVALGPLMFHYPLFGINFNPLGYLLLAIALVLTVYSGIRYFYNFYDALCKNDVNIDKKS